MPNLPSFFHFSLLTGCSDPDDLILLPPLSLLTPRHQLIPDSISWSLLLVSGSSEHCNGLQGLLPRSGAGSAGTSWAAVPASCSLSAAVRAAAF